MIDVFVRCAPENPVRAALALAVLERWMLEPDINLRAIWATGSWPTKFAAGCPIDVFLPKERFQWKTREYADKEATSNPYIFADDDHLPLGANFVRRMQKLWQEYDANNYVMIGANSILASENQTQYVSDPQPVYDAPHAMGATMMHRKGVLDYSKFEGIASKQDSYVCDFMRANKMRFAYFRDIHYLHLGFGLSQVEPRYWLKY